MEKKELEMICTYELSEEDRKELWIDDTDDDLVLFEWDPDYMMEPHYDWRGWVYFYPIYFMIWKNYIIVSEEPEHKEELMEFCLGQNPKVSLSGNTTRSETNHWEYLEKNNWEWWEECKNLKIAYRWGAWYVYTLFEYKEEEEN